MSRSLVPVAMLMLIACATASGEKPKAPADKAAKRRLEALAPRVGELADLIAQTRAKGLDAGPPDATLATAQPTGRAATGDLDVSKAVIRDGDWRVGETSGTARPIRCIGPNGRDAKPVEFRTIEFGDRRIGYMVGLGKEAASVTITRDGKPARWRSLLTGKVGGGSLTVQPFDFDLVEFE